MIWKLTCVCAKQWIYIKAFSSSRICRLRSCKNTKKDSQSSVVCRKGNNRRCLIWNISEIRTVYVAARLWKINSVGGESNYQNMFSQKIHSEFVANKLSCNKGPLGGSDARDEAQPHQEKALKTGRIWSIIIFCLYWEGPCIAVE